MMTKKDLQEYRSVGQEIRELDGEFPNLPTFHMNAPEPNYRGLSVQNAGNCFICGNKSKMSLNGCPSGSGISWRHGISKGYHGKRLRWR